MKKLVALLLVFIVGSVWGSMDSKYVKDSDTLKVLESQATQSQKVRVPIWLVNSIPISGISFNLVFNPSYLTALRVDTAGTRVSGVYNTFPTRIDNKEGSVFWNGLNFDDPFNNYVPPGSGPIAYVVFKIAPQTHPKSDLRIRFLQNPKESPPRINSFSTRSGELVIPILVDGWVRIGHGLATMSTEDIMVPPKYYLLESTPNPFKENTSIRYAFPLSSSEEDLSHILLRIYDSNGRLVRTLMDAEERPGWYTVEWDGKSQLGSKLPGGIYFCRMEVDHKIVKTKKLILLK